MYNYKIIISQSAPFTLMNYQPDWQSKALALLFPKRRLLTLLDTGQLMSYQLTHHSQFYQSISNKVKITVFALNSLIVGVSLYLARGASFSNKIFSRKRLAFDVALVLCGCWAGVLGFAHWVQEDVRREKMQYLLRYDDDFMRHFDLLWAKYNLNDELQTQGIFTKEQLTAWLQGYGNKLAQMP